MSTALAPSQTTLSLKEAVEQALAGHPALQASAGRVTASEGQRVQAGLRPNPRFVFQTENLRAHGRPPFSFSRDADTFAYLSQPLETAGKRARRVEVAEAGIHRARLEQELLRRLIAARVKQSYWSAAGARKVVDLLRENGRTFGQIVEYHQIRVREGAMAEADLLRVRLESDRLAIGANTAALEAERGRILLFREMGRSEFPDAVLADPLESPPPAGVDASEARALEARIEMQLARQMVERARAVLRLEQAAARPDVEAVLGYKRSSGFNTMIGGVQVELPLSKRNQGAIAAAAAEVKVAEAELAAAAATVRAEVNAARTEYEIRRRQVSESLRPLREGAAEGSRIAVAAYREGGTDLLRLLDAERLRVDAELLYYQTLTQYKQSEAALEAALGVAP
jgi:outer membrane protein TolC